MSSYALGSSHEDGASIPASTGTASGQVVITANTTLEQDKETVLRWWLALGGKEDTLRRRYYENYYKWKMRDEPSDNLAEWLGVTVEGWRVTELIWAYDESLMDDDIEHEPLTGTIPAEIGALDGLT